MIQILPVITLNGFIGLIKVEVAEDGVLKMGREVTEPMK